MPSPADLKYLNQAIDLAIENVKGGGRPFGAVLVKDGEVLATGVNRMLATHDPSSHAEMEAFRQAGPRLGGTDFSGTTLYASGQPCPMCLAAAIASKVEAVFYAYDNADAAPFGFSSQPTYYALGLSLTPPPLPMTKVVVEGRSAQDLYGPAVS